MSVTTIATGAAAISAAAAFVGLFVSIHYDRKTYKANLEINRELNSIDSVKQLVPKYLASVEYLCYLYGKASADQNDHRKKNRVTFIDYDKQMDKAKNLRKTLDLDLAVAKNTNKLVLDAQTIWGVLDELGMYFNSATNRCVSDKEKQFNKLFNKMSNLMMADCASWYQSEFKKLTQ